MPKSSDPATPVTSSSRNCGSSRSGERSTNSSLRVCSISRNEIPVSPAAVNRSPRAAVTAYAGNEVISSSPSQPSNS